MSANSFDTDVIIVGCGPTGATLGNLLAVCGITVIILDREDDIYPLPRAVHFDDEVMRVFQTIGISEKLNKIVNVNSGMRFVDNKDNVLLDWPRPKEIGIHGWYPSYRFHQPDLEILLRERLNEQKNIAIKFGVEVLSAKSHNNSCELSYLKKRSGKLEFLKSKFIIGCDGAKSIIRAAIGGEVNDHGFQEKWLVVDAILKKELPELGEFTMQYCDTKRPITYCHQPKNRRRWEIRLLESETEEEFEQKDRIWPLLKKWITPEVADLERTAIYTFKSMVASSWKKGRLFIAGDAAHLMPPFMGQGMCAGIRDAANLAWKIAAVIKKQSDKDLLDSYESERAPHVNSYIQTAIRLGSLINTTDPKKAFEVSSDNNRREAKMKSLYPVLGLGLGSNFSDSLKKHRGTIAGQPVLSNSHLLDDFCGYNTLCISREEIKGSSGKIDNLPFLCLDAQEEPILNEFLNELEVEAVIIRPDRYVLASARNENEIKKLLTIRL